MKRLASRISIVLLASAAMFVPVAASQPARAQNVSATTFAAPPDSAKPQTWWHWVSGNVTREGITADLEAMKRIGLKGAQIFTVNQGPKGPVQYMSPEWRALVQHAIKEAHRLGLELSITDCEGWSESGGPWITPEMSMQHVVYSVTPVDSDSALPIVLPRGADYKGYYRDIAVLAFPSLIGEEKPLGKLVAAVTSSDGPLDTSALGRPVTLHPANSDPSFMRIEFKQPVTFGSITMAPVTGQAFVDVSVSDDGQNYRSIGRISGGPKGEPEVSISFRSVTARYLRFSSVGGSSAPNLPLGVIGVGAARISSIGAKSGVEASASACASPDVDGGPGSVIDPAKIVDLTAKLGADGALSWTPPPGAWTIIRFGMTSTGTPVHPAMPETIGLECDKLSADAVRANWNGQMTKVIADSGPLAGTTLKTVLMDSWEAGTGNWTPLMPEDFRRLRGYDLRPWLPALTGRAVGGIDQTERFLRDYRRTMADLLAVNHYGLMSSLAHKSGMQLQAEAVGIGLPTVADELLCKGNTDIPMGEFWIGNPGTLTDDKEAASASHTYGKQYVAAESFTAVPDAASWTNDPFSLKGLGDRAFCTGVNDISFHRYAMQPYLDRYPGVTMGPWGLNFERTNTWWEPGKAWISYLTRSQFILQQGQFAGDICYFYGGGAPRDVGGFSFSPAPPPGYDYDVCNADVLLNRMTVKDGRIVLSSGMNYRVLVLPNSTNLTPELAAKVRDLVAAGATVVGPKPLASPSLTGYPGCDAAVRKIGDEVWANLDGVTTTRRSYGKGFVVWGEPLDKVLAGVGPDFTYEAGDAKTEVKYIHRRIDGADYYFVSNQSYAPVEFSASFRVDGKAPELWHPDTGEIENAALFSEREGRTNVPLRLDPAGSVFVVFRRPIAGVRHLAMLKAGQPMKFVAPEARPKISILKASYGSTTSADVTAVLKRWLDGGRKAMVANNDLAGGNDKDPAPNVVKSLFIDYSVDKAPCSTVITEGETISLPKAAPGSKVEILRASYGLRGSAVDVTGELANCVEKSDEPIRIGNALCGGVDPAPNIVKTLVVTYTLNGGAPVTKTVKENGTFSFGTSAVKVAVPDYTVRSASDGDVLLTNWRNDTVTYATATGEAKTLTISSVPEPLPISGPWTVHFPKGWGAPESVIFDKLDSWTNSADDGVKYFSGTAVYETTVNIPADRFGKNKALLLDLGNVKNLAEVTVNGHNKGVLWKSPFRIDVTGDAHAGSNTIRIKVTNLWPNRLIGDQFLPEDKRFTWTTFNPYKRESELLESGLLGPALLRSGVTSVLSAR
ncbi:MAG: glycosyl hydrolase [Capsulimonadaceae bacterium]|nr:glycosyl hydrolase [Capsulimonadaceae bacterium]